MKAITIETLAKVLGCEIAGQYDGDARIKGVSCDSRTIRDRDCFFAIKGENFDGHDYIDRAFENGAVCSVAADNYQEKGSGPILKVGDTVRALGKLAGWYREQMPFEVIAITGSAGKTTTREIVYHVLHRKFNCRRAPKSFNNQIGVPLTLLGADRHHEVVISELGSNRAGEISYLSRIVQPDIAVITNIYPAHLDGLVSIEAIITEKASICEGLKDGGAFLINGDFTELVVYCDQLGANFITFGEAETCDIRAEKLTDNGFCGEMTIDNKRICVPLPGRANLSNVLAAWSVCKQFGIDISYFAEAAKTFTSVKMRLQVQKVGELTVINDCYNANPASMANALDCLSRICEAEAHRAVFICGPMYELGEQSEEFHAQLGELAANRGVKVLAAAGPFAETVVKAAKNTAKDLQTYIFKNTGELCNNLQRFVRYDDIVLVKGSRIAALEAAVEKLHELFARP